MCANMSRRNLRSQVDDLRQEKEYLEAENSHLQDTLQAEVNRLRENKRVQEENKATAALGETQLEEEQGKTQSCWRNSDSCTETCKRSFLMLSIEATHSKIGAPALRTNCCR